MPSVKRHAHNALQLGDIVGLMGRREENKKYKLKLEAGLAAEYSSLIDKAGGQQAVGDIAGMSQSNVSRVLKGTATTLDSLMRLYNAVPGAPRPFVMTKSRMHARWCRLGAVLLEKAPEKFAEEILRVEKAARLSGISDEEWGSDELAIPNETAVAALKSVIANPLRTDRKRGVRRG